MLKLMRAPGKYVQGKDALHQLYDYVKEFGKNFLFVCSKSGAASTQSIIEMNFKDQDVKTRFEIFGGMSSISEIDRIGKIIEEEGIDVVCAVGGGSAIDTAKASAHEHNLPVVIIPTVCATDAPCTGLSVIYKDDGTVSHYLFYPQNPEAVIVDTSIIVKAPIRFLVAGMGDALGTYFEARICKSVGAPSLENGGITNSAMALCELCYESLLRDGYNAKLAAEKGAITPAFETVVEATTYLSGVGADNGGLAAAHSVYNGFTALEENTAMHGEVVAFGTLVQLVLEDADPEELDEVFNFCVTVGLPITLEEMGITKPERVMLAAEKACAEGETIHNMPGDVTPTQLYDAILAADAMGQEYI